MARITEYRDILLDDLVLGQGQARTESTARSINDLKESIRAQGLLQPIVVCPAREEGKWEILTGQRRFLAHRLLKEDVISCAILDHRVDHAQAKAISITENLIRRKLSSKETKDGILYLYNLYGSIEDVYEATGLPRDSIRGYVKYPRLLPELKQMVDDQEVDVNTALKAQDSSNDEEGNPDPELAVKLAREMNPMTGPQRKKFVTEHKKHPEKPVHEAIERAKTGANVVQIITTLTRDTHTALQQFAREEGTNQDEAAVVLIEESLVGHGFLEE